MIIRQESGDRWLPVRIGDFEKWQASLLEESARRLGAVLAPGGRVHRWGFVGSPVTFRGQRAWLRVSPFLEHEMSRKAWRGTAEAAAIEGVCKPALLHRIEWRADPPSPIPVSAEVLTLVTDPLASRERFLRTAPDLPADWSGDLSASLAALRAYRTDRRFPVHDAAEYGYLLSGTYRRPVPAGCVPAFGTEHIDLNWENITAPRFQIPRHGALGRGRHRLRRRLLYLTALEVPAVAARVHEALADVLDTPTGRYAQLVATALILRYLTRLPDPGGLAARLHHRTLDLLTKRRPYQLALSLYGATEESYDGMTRRRGSFRRFMRGLAAANEAELPMRINIVVSNRNAHEIPQMKAIADRYGIPSFEYTNISPTIHGGGEVLPSQSREVLRTRQPYTG